MKRKKKIKERLTLGKIINLLVPLLKEHNVVRAAVFGSFAKGTPSAKSDVDLLVKFRGQKTLIDHVHLQLAVQDVLKRKADVITYNGINPMLKKSILKSQYIFYEEKMR
ncbi:MAG: nucleotidyltransferase domain-containing protein [Candidatus Uhrbacteria bacterium]|nr:nucleotidyltransferase domain-containing protein [Candidatus Uhrbacteria bacterium]